MATFCLPKINTEKFIEALKSGKIDPAKLIDMTSAERREFFKDIVGEENAREVNALLESKLLLKDQKRGLVSWAKKVSGISEATRTDLLSKIERMDHVLRASDEGAFLEDLAAKKLGTDVTFEEAQKVTDATQDVLESKAKWDPAKAEADLKADPNNKNAGWESEDARLEYGYKYIQFQKFITELKNSNKVSDFKTQPFTSVAGLFKSIQAALDNSYFLRQGIKTLFTLRNADIWMRNFVKSWGDIGRELKKTKNSPDPIDVIKSEIYSRPNAVNGKYDKMDLDIGLNTEEAFPSSLPERIPLLGRLFKASETAYNGAALRFRADLADRMIQRAEEFGLNMNDKMQARAPGTLVNSMTGRGKVPGFTPGGSKFVNNAFFSIKFLKSNYDALTAHSAGFGIEKGPGRDFVRREAAKNLLAVVSTIGTINVLANILYPGSATLDPRSSNFGKIKIGNHTIDTTGGMGALVTLAARITPSMHDGKWGLWMQSGTGKWTHLNDPKFGEQNGVDVINSFFENKASPLFQTGLNFLRGRDFQNRTPTPLNQAQSLITPIPLQNFLQLRDPSMANTIGLTILDALGASVSTPPPPKK